MRKSVENGNDQNPFSKAAKEGFVIPKNGIFSINGIEYRAVEGQIYTMKSGEDIIRELSALEIEMADKLSPLISFLSTNVPNSSVPDLRGVQKDARRKK
jgi:hypothetical protein